MKMMIGPPIWIGAARRLFNPNAKSAEMLDGAKRIGTG